MWTRYDHLWSPPLQLTLSEWADRERRISYEASAEPGRWVTAKAPYQREIMDAISDPGQREVVMMSAAQVGKSEILNNTIGMHIDIEPCPMMMIQPTIEDAETYSKDRIAPMIRITPCLAGKVKEPRVRDSGNTLRHKKFPGGQLYLAGANSPSGLASKPIRVLLMDEVDRYPASAGTEGDPVSIATKRTQNFWNRKIVSVSTPTVKGISRIEKLYEASTQEEWRVPCPHCGQLTAMDWNNFVYEDLSDVRMKCPFCGTASPETLWKSNQACGKWIAGNPKAAARGFHITGFSSPWATWRDLVTRYLEAKKNGDDDLKVWWNTTLGLPYEEQGAAIEVENLESHREEYAAEVPDGVLVLTCGVDTQDDRLEAEVVGWGAGKESWGIAYRVFYGDPGQDGVWKELDEFLSRLWSYGDREQIGLSCTCIDSGGHYTDEVYRFVKPRERRNIFAIKGSSVHGKPGVSKPSRSNRRRVALFSLGTSALKGSLFSRLKVETPGPGYCHWPKELASNHRGYDAPYFRGLVSERMVTKKTGGRLRIEWVKRSAGTRNEPLDTRVYAMAALEILNPDLEKRERRIVGAKRKRKKRERPQEPVVIREVPELPELPEQAEAERPVEKKKGQRRGPRGSPRVVSRGIR